ncbi:GNAT family N-acetyltransferase [Methylopila musalis]|uniref:GNAT family N-acetyltransferase n=1 Tax=Methylopila musalis TaxID=1134781 RepID=A0ABW3Z7D4_9HYPH
MTEENGALVIRRADASDGDAIWDVIRPTLRAGETYALPRDISKAEALALWLAPDRETYLAEDGGRALGVSYLRANQGGGGAHVANCGYVTAPEAVGRGVARALCAHSLARARYRGFRAMQFNFVVSTNDRAVRLWRSFGFDTVGVLPDAFEHPTLGVVDALVMHRRL